MRLPSQWDGAPGNAATSAPADAVLPPGDPIRAICLLPQRTCAVTKRLEPN
jgi:hypothetical protein